MNRNPTWRLHLLFLLHPLYRNLCRRVLLVDTSSSFRIGPSKSFVNKAHALSSNSLNPLISVSPLPPPSRIAIRPELIGSPWPKIKKGGLSFYKQLADLVGSQVRSSFPTSRFFSLHFPWLTSFQLLKQPPSELGSYSLPGGISFKKNLATFLGRFSSISYVSLP